MVEWDEKKRNKKAGIGFPIPACVSEKKDSSDFAVCAFCRAESDAEYLTP